MKLAALLPVMLFAVSTSVCQFSVQTFGTHGRENANNHFTATGVETFLEDDAYFLVGTLSYLRAGVNSFRSGVTPAVYSGISVLEGLELSSRGITNRYTVTTRGELFTSSGWNAALLTGFSYEEQNTDLVLDFRYTPRPAPVGWDTILVSTTKSVNRYFVLGPEVSTFLEFNKVGGGVVYMSDFHGLFFWQPYLFATSNTTRRAVGRVTLGANLREGFQPIVEGQLRWKASPGLDLVGTIWYSRTTFVYNVFARYLSFYREKNDLALGAMGVYEAWPGTTIFVGSTFARNDSFNMLILTAGVYLKP